jgi:hypothetical protein
LTYLKAERKGETNRTKALILLASSRTYNWIVYTAVTLLCILAFCEAPSPQLQPWERPGLAVDVLLLLCMLLLSGDVVLELWARGLTAVSVRVPEANEWKPKLPLLTARKLRLSLIIRAVLVMLIIGEHFLQGVIRTPFRLPLTCLLRPLLVALRETHTKDSMAALLLSLYRSRDVFVFFLLFVGVMSVAALELFAGSTSHTELKSRGFHSLLVRNYSKYSVYSLHVLCCSELSGHNVYVYIKWQQLR